MNNDLLYIDEHGILGSNFYWNHFERYGFTKQDAENVGLTGPRVQIHKDLIPILKEVDETFQRKFGYRLYIKEGYRSKELYELVYNKRVEFFGKEETDKLLNMKDMPHSLGKSIDVALWDEKTNSEVLMRNKADGPDSYMCDFYKNREDEEGKRYQYLQSEVIEIMKSFNFSLGKKNEFFHFNYLK